MASRRQLDLAGGEIFPLATEGSMMLLQPVAFRGRLVAAASPERFFLGDRLDALEDDHPDRRFVTFMCAYARDVMQGQLPGPYDDAHAELYARCVLVADDDFRRCDADLDDPELAERYGIPLDQVPLKRHDLRQLPRWIRPGARGA